MADKNKQADALSSFYNRIRLLDADKEVEMQRLKDLAEARENSDAYRRGLPDRPRT